MKIHLFSNHTALVVNDSSSTLTTEPPCAGKLEIEGYRFAVAREGTQTPSLPKLNGAVRATFITDGGVRYPILHPRVAAGVLHSSVDYTQEYISMRIHMDALERQVEAMAAQLNQFRAEFHPNALGFLTHNTKKTEVH